MGAFNIDLEHVDTSLDLNEYKGDLIPDIDLNENNTLLKLMRFRYREWGDKKVWMTHKDFGIWQPFSWKDCYEHIELVHLGLVSLGLEPGDMVGIIGDTDPRWFWAEFAVVAAKGIVAGMYTDYHYEEVKYILGFSKAKFAFAKDQEMMDKIVVNVEKGFLPNLKKVIYWEAKGLWFYDYDWMLSYDELEELGREYKKSHPNLFEENIDRTEPDEPACVMLSSGTTRMTEDGVPRSQMGQMTHRAIMANMLGLFRLAPWKESDRWLSFLSPAWAEQYFGITTALLFGTEVAFPEEPETSMSDIREIGPQALLFGARLWDAKIREASGRLADSSWFKKIFYDLFLPIGEKMAPYNMTKRKAPLWLRIAYKLGYWIVFRPMRDQMGLLTPIQCLNGGSTLSPDSLRWFHALGVPVKQIYGTTEAGLHSIHPDDDIDGETVGKIVNLDWVKISEEGEVLLRGAIMGCGYLNDLEAWEKNFDDEGWYHTGDAGHINEKGHLIFYDRMKDMVTVPSGRKFSPQYVEARLNHSRFISDCLVIGGEDKEFVSAIVMIDYENAGDWAEKRHIAYTTYPDLSQKPKIYDLVREDMVRVNQYLAEDIKIRKFCNLHKEFDPDDAEMTRSGKIRRKFMEERYHELIETIYSGEEKYETEAPVKYRDGRTGKIRTAVSVKTV